MKLRKPFEIGSNLLPTLRIHDAHISLARSAPHENRDTFTYEIDITDGRFTGEIRSGVGGGTLQQAFQALLDFLEAAGESYDEGGKHGENYYLLVPAVVKWAAVHLDEIAFASLEIEEPNLIVE